MEPNLSNYMGGVKPSQGLPVTPQKQIPINKMSREQIYDYLRKNPAPAPEVQGTLPPEVLNMASDLRNGERQAGQITLQAKMRRQAAAVKRNVPGR